MKKYYLGLDIGTDSVGYATTDEKYNLMKFHGEPAWGVTIFDAASLCDERRSHRTARRRLDRRQQRVALVQELFAKEIAKIDSRFYIRIKESQLYREETEEQYILFNDDNFSDKEYFDKYPTIHHLLVDLMYSKEPHDVRLIYLACSWLVAHRGHFLSNIDKNNLEDIKNFQTVYETFLNYFDANDYARPWDDTDVDALAMILRRKIGVGEKQKKLTNILLQGSKPSKEAREEFPFSQEGIIRLLSGGTSKLKDLFCNDSYEGSVQLGMDDEKFAEIMTIVGDDYGLIEALRSIYDWTVLVDALGEYRTISEAKVAVYEQHKADLSCLKRLVRRYCPEQYDEVFRGTSGKCYATYVQHTNTSSAKELGKRISVEDFLKYILGIFKNVDPMKEDVDDFKDMMSRCENQTFLPKQKNTDNRVIPHQLYWYELNRITENAATYLPMLNETGEDGITTRDKIMSVFLFRIPYFVGPLNTHSSFAWISRKAGKIYPWNFEDIVDLDASEQYFIQKMTNYCTYLPGEPVLPKDSLAYHKFMVLNEINNLRINGVRIDVELKQRIYREVFLVKKKVTRKYLVNYLLSNGFLEKGKEDGLSGIDIDIKSNLVPQIAFSGLISRGILSENDAERIIERSSYAEDKARLSLWLVKNYPEVSDEDRKYICNLKFKDFGRVSRKFLTGISGADRETGECRTILSALWETQNNLMELLSNRYTYLEEIEEYQREYYASNKMTLDKRMDDMYLSNSVRRSVYRTLDIVHDVKKAFGAPEKIFVEMTRSNDPDRKGKRTSSRRQQILDLYEHCRDEDVRILRQQLEEMGSLADNRLQSDKLFLYFLQQGKSMYSGKTIELEKLGSREYDIDHIYPQSLVKDDSIINNKVLVLSTENGAKQDIYPIKESIRKSMYGFWTTLKNRGAISEEKYKRLTRHTPFTEEEKYGFINRQLTETSQSTKAVATLLKEYFPDTQIVYCKARLVSEFRQEFDLYKSRTFNDLHHAVDAYLNIVTGNVYDMKFNRKWFNVNSKYSLKTKTLFTYPQICNGITVWEGEESLKKVKAIAVKNNAHFTKYAFFKNGGLFDQMPVSSAEGLIPRKQGLSTERYGGYNKAAVMFYIPVRYKAGKKTEVIILSVEKMYGEKFLQDEAYAKEYAFDRLKRILGKKIDDLSFPMGMRPWKVNTVLSLDGFRICISGIGSGGKTLVAQSIMQFSESSYWQFYMKKLEMFAEKVAKNPQYIYDERYDKISVDDNYKLYEIYCQKLEHSIYSKRVNPPTELLNKGKTKFKLLSIQEQVITLMNIHQVFGRMTGGCDLHLIGGAKKTAATVNFSSSISNWKKNYKNVQLLDISPAGLWTTNSENILDLV